MELDHIMLHNIIKFNEIATEEKVINNVQINGHTDEESVRLINKKESTIVSNNFNETTIEVNYDKYGIVYNKKTHRERPIRFRTETTNDYFDIYNFYSYKTSEVLITTFDFSKQIAKSAIHKLNSKSARVKFSDYNVDLFKFIENIANLALNIEITSTWFNNLDLPNLNAVKLEGEEVNLGSEWDNYKSNPSSKATSLGLCINEAPFNNLKLSLSHEGSVYINPGRLEEQELLKLAKLIINIIEHN